ncbi:MAG: PQQ-binding-like beta-propeller repeat protein [Rhodopirellula sp.]|nr:PQQ-binding-like beta-propeller repeat protein [Rhodopirellula sp.]
MSTLLARLAGVATITLAVAAADAAHSLEPAEAAGVLDRIGIDRGICVVLGMQPGDGPELTVELARQSELCVWFQSPDAGEVAAVRQSASAAGLLGSRIFADSGGFDTLPLADNIAGAIVTRGAAERQTPEAELFRVLHPEGVALLGNRCLVKPCREGVDSWSHVYHGPDNNPLSTDQIARAPYLTQFLGDPKFCPMPEVSVAAGGRVFRAFGHIAHKANQNAMLNTLLGINGYNGAILWRRPLHEGFMIHRNTMIATSEVLYLGDDESCKILDAGSGELRGEIVAPAEITDGPVWKWMALDGGVLYALVGHEEVRPQTQRSEVPGLGHWPWGMWQGHEYKDPKTSFGFGRTLVAIDPSTKEVLWHHREEDFVDARGIAMKNGRIYFYSPQKFLACLDVATRKVVWRNASQDLLEAIGRDGPAQHYTTGYSTTTFFKCSDRYLFFAGPQRTRMVVASTDDGRLVWQKETGNLQLVLRDDAVYCAGPQGAAGFKLAYGTGETLASLPGRRACTRATGTVDSVFFRASGGTVRIDVADDTAKHLALMRPPCQDGVIVSDGFLYWGPWMCGCQLSLYGHICLGPAGGFDFHPEADGLRLNRFVDDPAAVKPFETRSGDWTTYLADNARSATTDVRLPAQIQMQWSCALPGGVRATAPIVAGETVFVGDDSGAVHALNVRDGSVRWKTYTGGAVYFPPALWQGRLYVGSADGHVYALEAATGRLLWRYRAAPADRRIPVYGKLISTWPVAGGVAVADGVVYAAAGIAHYDGTYVYALDAVSGKVLWCNDTSGRQAAEVDCGISLQGNLSVADGELRFLGGSKYNTARYDLKTGECLNPPENTIVSQFRTAFSPYYPEYGRYMSLAHRLPDGKELIYEASYEGSQHLPLTLFGPLPPGTGRTVLDQARWPLARRGGPKRDVVWIDKSGRRLNALAVTPTAVLATGHTGTGDEATPFLAAIDTTTGADLWRFDVPATAERGGLALDHAGRIVAVLDGGRIVTFGDKVAFNPAAGNNE